MNSTLKTILIASLTSLIVLLIVGAGLWWFAPGLLPGFNARTATSAGFGPGFGSGMMGRGFSPMGARGMNPSMMSDVHEMADIESEYEFLVQMIPHHQEAVETAKQLRDRTNTAEMRRFAQSIIDTQSQEIDQMQAWLEQWYPDQEHTVDYEPMMGDYSSLSGEEIDITFLQDMIPHHMAAVMMSQQLLSARLADHSDVDELARNISDSQMQEIRQMSLWLRQWDS